MKKNTLLALALIILSSTGTFTKLYADTELEFSDISQESITDAQDSGPFEIQLTTDYISKAHFDKRCFRNQYLIYQDSHIDGAAVVYYNKCCKEGLRLTLSYDTTLFDWHHNPFFHKKHFNTISVGLQGFSQRVCGWLWKAQVLMNLDTKHTSNPSLYANYDFLLWGRYDYCPGIGIHTGFLAQTGMKIDRVYPIIGVDWQVDPSLKLNVVYPVNLSAVYTISPCWTAAIAGRCFDRRQRVGKDEPLKRGLWAYRAKGVEAALNYYFNSWLKINAHVGRSFGAKITISDRHHNHKEHFRLKGSRYIGGEITANF